MLKVTLRDRPNQSLRFPWSTVTEDPAANSRSVSPDPTLQSHPVPLLPLIKPPRGEVRGVVIRCVVDQSGRGHAQSTRRRVRVNRGVSGIRRDRHRVRSPPRSPPLLRLSSVTLSPLPPLPPLPLMLTAAPEKSSDLPKFAVVQITQGQRPRS